MILAATSGPAGDVPGAAPVAAGTRARVAVSQELRRAYRALGRAPVARPERAASTAIRVQGSEGDAPAPAEAGGDAPGTTANAVVGLRRNGPDGGYPVRVRAPDDTGTSLELSILVSVAGPRDGAPSWSLDLLMDPGGRLFARLILGLGSRGRSGTREQVIAITALSDLPALQGGLAMGDPSPLQAPGLGAGNQPILDCLTADGRLAPRTTRWKDTA